MDIENLSPMVFGLISIGVLVVLLKRIGKRKLQPRQTALLLFSPILALLIFAVTRYYVLDARLAPFKAHLSEYTVAAEDLPGEAYIRGKVIPVDLRKNEIDFVFYYELPKTMRAASPEEVQTVVARDCTTSQVGTYTRGGGAHRWTCKLQVIDLTVPRVVAVETFVGSDPPRTKSGSGKAYGSKPTQETIDYLISLPLR